MGAIKTAAGDGDLFHLTIRGRNNYEILMKVRDALELADRIPQEIKAEHQANKASEDFGN